MSFPQRVVAAILLGSPLTSVVVAQFPPAPTQAPPPVPGSQPAAVSSPGRPTTPVRLAPTPTPHYRRSIVHHNPYPYPNYYENDQTAGFRNPGGVGRFREYYPPGNQFQANQERDPVQVAKFDQGGGAPDRAEQLQAESLGIAKYNSIQGHIDNYARPAFGFGFGVGGFGGFY